MKITFITLLFVTMLGGFRTEAVGQTTEAATPPQARLYETLGKSYDEAIWRILRGFYDELSIDPGADGRIISYGSSSQIGFFQRIVRARIKTAKFDASRIRLINGGKQPKTEHQFWIIPAGANPPKP